MAIDMRKLQGSMNSITAMPDIVAMPICRQRKYRASAICERRGIMSMTQPNYRIPPIPPIYGNDPTELPTAPITNLSHRTTVPPSFNYRIPTLTTVPRQLPYAYPDYRTPTYRIPTLTTVPRQLPYTCRGVLQYCIVWGAICWKRSTSIAIRFTISPTVFSRRDAFDRCSVCSTIRVID